LQQPKAKRHPLLLKLKNNLHNDKQSTVTVTNVSCVVFICGLLAFMFVND